MLYMPVLLLLLVCSVKAWVSPKVPSTSCHAPAVSLSATPLRDTHDVSDSSLNNRNDRHKLPDPIRRGVVLSSLLSISALSSPALALVKGNAPPSSMKPTSERPKCTNVEECQEMAERKQAQEDVPKGPPPKTTRAGTRYIDMENGNASKGVVRTGDEVNMYYKVLKLGKRSYDGLSGEGTVVFSRGYGLEDDEKGPGSKSFKTTIGSPDNIAALNDAVVGMNVGGTRRFSILPQQGWERPTAQCDGGPGGKGAGGDLKTDYVIVPTATMVATEECFDKTKLPFPSSYGQERRMAQRFDQSLIMEVQVVAIK